MNCANHPDVPVAAYCQNCGKPLCATCVRSVSGVVYCEQCLAAKLGGRPGASYTVSDTGYTVSGATKEGVNYTVSDTGAYTVSGFAPDASGAHLGPNPGLAALLGFIPGVGAMYNGQFIKALVHVLVFVVLIGITNEHDIFGMFIAFWVFYQVFDAFQTAKARRNGLPLPDPFGLNELGQRMGIPNRQPGQPAQAYYAAPPPPPPSASPYGDVPYTPAPPPPVPPVPPIPENLARRPEPIGAIVLIVVGMLFLFSTLGFLRFDWISHGWPILVIVVGVWLLVRRSREVAPPEPPAGGGQ
jgi:TM2 domain-containing membrane protein YozV